MYDISETSCLKCIGTETEAKEKGVMMTRRKKMRPKDRRSNGRERCLMMNSVEK